MARYSDSKLQNKSVEELQRIKDELEQGKRTTPVPSQSKFSDSQLQSMTVEQLQNLREDLIPSTGINNELKKALDSLMGYVKIHFPNEYKNFTDQKLKQNNYITISSDRDTGCMDIYALNYCGPDGILGGYCTTPCDDCCFYNDESRIIAQGDWNWDGALDVLDIVGPINCILGQGDEYYLSPNCGHLTGANGMGYEVDGIPQVQVYIPPYNPTGGGGSSIEYNDILIEGGSDVNNDTFVYNVVYYPMNDERFWPVNSNEEFLEKILLAFNFNAYDMFTVYPSTMGAAEASTGIWLGSSWMTPGTPDFTSIQGGIVLMTGASGTLNWGNAL